MTDGWSINQSCISIELYFLIYKVINHAKIKQKIRSNLERVEYVIWVRGNTPQCLIMLVGVYSIMLGHN